MVATSPRHFHLGEIFNVVEPISSALICHLGGYYTDLPSSLSNQAEGRWPITLEPADSFGLWALVAPGALMR